MLSRIVSTLLLITALVFIPACFGYRTTDLLNFNLDSNADLAKKIVDFAVSAALEQPSADSKRFPHYKLVICKNRDFYSITVATIPRQKEKALIIDYYSTTYEFGNASYIHLTPSDLMNAVTQEMNAGKIKIYTKIFLISERADGKVNLCRIYTKNKGGGLEEFTAEEVNGSTDKTPVQVYIYQDYEKPEYEKYCSSAYIYADHGDEFVYDIEFSDVQKVHKIYREHLEKICQYLGLK